MVTIQENGIIRAPDGYLIGRLTDEVDFESIHLTHEEKMSSEPNTAEEIKIELHDLLLGTRPKSKDVMKKVEDYTKARTTQTLDRLENELPDRIADMLGIYGSCEYDVGNGCQKFDSGNCNCRTGFVLKLESIIKEVQDA